MMLLLVAGREEREAAHFGRLYASQEKPNGKTRRS
jgi:hypothetical protein